MKVTLGIKVELGISQSVEVESTTPGGSFVFPVRIGLQSGPGLNVEVFPNRVLFAPLRQHLLVAWVGYEAPTERTSFKVTFDPTTVSSEAPRIFLWNLARGPEPTDENSAFWDEDSEQILHLLDPNR